MSKLSQEEVQSLRSRICHGEQGLISTLTPEQFLALLSYDYDTGFAAGKASAQEEILCMLAADGMSRRKLPYCCGWRRRRCGRFWPPSGPTLRNAEKSWNRR